MNSNLKMRLIILLLFFLQSCIPINIVNEIETYKIIEAKPKSRKEIKKFTRYKFSNRSSIKAFYSFLKFKKKDVYEYKNKFYVSGELIVGSPDVDFIFRFLDKKNKYFSIGSVLLNNALERKNNNDQSTTFNNGDDELFPVILYGDEQNFIEIQIVDKFKNKDYLSLDSENRKDLIRYLEELRKEYNRYLQ